MPNNKEGGYFLELIFFLEYPANNLMGMATAHMVSYLIKPTGQKTDFENVIVETLEKTGFKGKKRH